MAKTLGIIGVGQLASFLVKGLRLKGDCRPIILASRNAEIAQELQQQHGCTLVLGNQEVIDESDIVLLAVRPNQVEAALADVTFRPAQLLISVVAGVGLQALKRLASPASVVRAMPAASAEVGEGAIPLFPEESEASALLAPLGEVVLFADEVRFEQSTLAACINGWLYAFFDELTAYFITRGFDSAQARQLVLHAARGATGLALQYPDRELAEIAQSIAREGTLTRSGLDKLQASQALSAWRSACDQVLRRLE